MHPLKYRFLVVLLCFAFPVLGQQKLLDSLLKVVGTLNDDSVKVRTYGSIAHNYHRLRTHDKARMYADSTKWLAEKLGFEGGVMLAYYQYSKIEEFAGNYEKSKDYLNTCYTYYAKNHDSTRMGNALFGLGKLYKSMGDLDASLSKLYESIMVFEKLNDKGGQAIAWNSIGGIYRQLNRAPEAITSYHKANAIYKDQGDTTNYAMGLSNLGNVYGNLEKHDSARILYHQALDLIHLIRKPYEESIVLGNLGRSYNKLDQHATALMYHLQALPIRKKIGNKKSIAVGMKDIAFSRMKLGQLKEADILIRDALVLATELHAMDLLREFYEVQSDIAVARKDFKQAYASIRLSHQWRDSVFNEESSSQINELKARYESEKKDQQIVLLAKEKEVQQKETERQFFQKRAFIIGFILVIVLAAVILYANKQKVASQKLLAEKDHQIREVNLRQQMTQLEMKALRAQINPHFLFNCMNSINRMILDGERDNASTYLTKFSKLMRLILEHAEASSVSLQNELDLLASYIQLEMLRFKGKIEYTIRVDDRIDSEATYLPSMVLQPFVENAIWHGLMHKSANEKGTIEIFVTLKDDKLVCLIEDNGVGRERSRQLNEQAVLKPKSMGIKITEERLRLISSLKLDNLINIFDLKDSKNQAAGTRVEIQIPVLDH